MEFQYLITTREVIKIQAKTEEEARAQIQTNGLPIEITLVEAAPPFIPDPQITMFEK